MLEILLLSFMLYAEISVEAWDVTEAAKIEFIQHLGEKYCREKSCKEVDLKVISDGEKVQFFTKCKEYII